MLAFYLDQKQFTLGAFVCEKIMHFTCRVAIGRRATIGPGIVIRHVGSIVIGNSVVIGANCEIRQGVTMGGNLSKTKNGMSHPCLGNNILVGARAKILGPIKIGSNSIVGANAVVTKDMPDNSIIGGIPAKVIREVRSDGNPLVKANN